MGGGGARCGVILGVVHQHDDTDAEGGPRLSNTITDRSGATRAEPYAGDRRSRLTGRRQGGLSVSTRRGMATTGILMARTIRGRELQAHDSPAGRKTGDEQHTRFQGQGGSTAGDRLKHPLKFGGKRGQQRGLG